MIGFTAALAEELVGTRIATWAVCPGQVDTPMALRAGASERDRPGMIPPESVARMILALASGTRRVRSGRTIDVTR